MIDSSMKPLKWISPAVFKLSDLIDATHILVVPHVFVLSFPNPFLRVVGSGTVRLVMCVTYVMYIIIVHNC